MAHVKPRNGLDASGIIADLLPVWRSTPWARGRNGGFGPRDSAPIQLSWQGPFHGQSLAGGGLQDLLDQQLKGLHQAGVFQNGGGAGEPGVDCLNRAVRFEEQGRGIGADLIDDGEALAGL